MDKFDEALFSIAKEQTQGMDFASAWTIIQSAHDKKKKRIASIIRYSSMAAMLTIGVFAGMLAERAGLLGEPKSTGTNLPADPVEVLDVPKTYGDPEEIAVPPVMDGSETEIEIAPPKTDGAVISFVEEKRTFNDMPQSESIEELTPKWLPTNAGELLVNSNEKEWESAKDGLIITARLCTAFNISEEMGEGLSIGEGRLRSISGNYMDGSICDYEWVVRVTPDLYLNVWFYGCSRDETIELMESIRIK